jgi:hypothetical protein
MFESPGFSGRMRRVFGPLQLKSISAGSVIVGPEAVVEIHSQSKGRPEKLHLESNRLVTDLVAVLKGAKMGSTKVSVGLARKNQRS